MYRHIISMLLLAGLLIGTGHIFEYPQIQREASKRCSVFFTKNIDKPRLFQLISLIAAALYAIGCCSCAYEMPADGISSEQLYLDIYVDGTGKALVTGYAEDIDALPFLEKSQFQYENNTSQFYAITNSLTKKDGDDWEIKLTTNTSYQEYHTTFYLPSDVKLNGINASASLEYLVSASNDSIIVEFYGYDVNRPTTVIDYLQSLEKSDKPSVIYVYRRFIVAIFLLALAAIILMIKLREKRDIVHAQEKDADQPPDLSLDEREKIAVTNEMAAVIGTLTERERAVVNALIKHGGKMTQAEIRYETGIPKSSLTGILNSLEKRRIIVKKGWGRTNILELSESFKPSE